MEKDLLKKFKMNTREDIVIFLKSLWSEKPQKCPFCKGKLDFFHKKSKKSNTDWICTNCSSRFDTIKILNELNE